MAAGTIYCHPFITKFDNVRDTYLVKNHPSYNGHLKKAEKHWIIVQ
jgi:hypothetical protein